MKKTNNFFWVTCHGRRCNNSGGVFASHPAGIAQKLLCAIAAGALLLCACATGAKPAASGGMTLDQAIAEAAGRIDERVEAGSKIALLNFSSPSDQFSSYVLDELTANLLDTGKLTVVDRKEVDLIRSEFDFQFSGGVGDDSMQELGRMLGAQSIVSGSLAEIGKSYRIVIRVLNVQSAAVAVQYRNDISNDERVQALLGGGRTGQAGAASGGRTQASTGSTATTGGAQAAAPAQPARPKAGTYYFYPRIQAYKSGVPDNSYIDKVVVRGNYMTFYITSTPAGQSGSKNPWVGSGSGGNLLQDLDNPRRSWKIIDHEIGDTRGDKPAYLTFENVTGTRFTLTNLSAVNYGSGDFIYEEIDLSKAEYEP